MALLSFNRRNLEDVHEKPAEIWDAGKYLVDYVTKLKYTKKFLIAISADFS